MSELKVDTQALGDYGGLFERFGTDNVGRTGPGTKAACGRTSDMEGLLDVIAPAIKAVADGFGDHYDDLAHVCSATGTTLTKVAADYQKTDHAVANNLDADAVVAAGGHDNAFGTGGGWSETIGPISSYDAEADPAKAIRDDMDADVRAIDWVFNKFTGHHITEPIDHLVGNWTTLTARGKSWHDVSTVLKQHGDDVLHNAGVIDGVWDGVAASSFQAYATNLGNGLHGESEIPLGLQAALDKVADEWEKLYQECVDLLQSVIHDVEIAAAALAAAWWCGVGEAVAAEKCSEALIAFYRAYKIVKMVKMVIDTANQVVKGFETLKDALDLATHIPEAIEGKVEKVKSLISTLGDVPDHLSNLGHLGDTPTSPYGGPSAPNA